MAGEPVELLEIPAGWFQMGWDAGLPDARPAHPVWVDGFRLARTPVTNTEFGAFLRASGAPPPPFWADPRIAIGRTLDCAAPPGVCSSLPCPRWSSSAVLAPAPTPCWEFRSTSIRTLETATPSMYAWR